MNLSPRVRRVLVVVGVLAALVAAAVVWLPSVVVRQVALHYLDRAGVTASIEHVDANLFTGTLVLANAEGHGPEGDGFSISRLRVSLDYAPLLSKRIDLSRLALEDVTVDVRRGADDALRIGGITVARANASASEAPDWGLALQQLTLRGLSIHYVQPARGQQPAIDRELVFNESSARDIVTWQKDNATTLDANMRVGDGRIQLKGRITPFGKTLSAHFELRTDNFSPELLFPFARAGDVQRLTGTVDSDQQIDIRYDSAKTLSVTIDGSADWQGSKLALAQGLALSGTRFKWQGKLALELLRAGGKPPTVDSNGRLQVTDLALEKPGAFQLSQASGDWQGQAGATLGAKALRLHADGKLTGQGLDATAGNNNHIAMPQLRWNGAAQAEMAGGNKTRFSADGQFAAERVEARMTDANRIDARALNWQGTIQAQPGAQTRINGNGTLKADDLAMTIADNSRVNARGLRWQGQIDSVASAGTQVDTNGSLKARELKLQVPGSLDLEAAPLTWRGTIGVSKQQTTHIQSDGRLDTGVFTFAVPDTAIFKTGSALWKGALDLDIGQQLARTARGRLIANRARLDLPGQPLALASDGIVFNGDYSQQPAGNGLKLRLNGDIASQAFALTHTRIDAPWAALRDVEIDNLAVDGVDRIGFDTLTAQGTRLLGDTDTSAAVLDAITATARGFQLTDLRDYRLSNLNFDGANIHLRRDAQGMGVMALYFGGNTNDQAAEESKPARQPATYAIDHLSLSAPLIVFNDVSVAPAVSLQGAQLEFNLNDLDTGRPERDASYRLSLDIGRYGHLDSLGTIAPLASGGMNMNLEAWMRSLALAPLSGYLNAALGRRIARGVADGTLDLKATNGQLKGNLDTTLSNFQLVDNPDATTDIVLGISTDTALDMVRRDSDIIRFETAILGDVINPYFSIRSLVREAVLAGLRSTVLSDYSPLGLLNSTKKALFDLGRPLASKPVVFPPGRHYVRPQDRRYLSKIAQSMRRKPKLTLTIQGHATPQDADAMAGFAANLGNSAQSLTTLAEQRATAVRDYLAARDVNPDRLSLAKPKIEDSDNTQPRVTFNLCKHE